MAIADWFSTRSPLVLEGRGVRLRPYRAADYAEWAEVRMASRDFLQPWEPTWPEDDLSRAGFRRRLTAYQREIETNEQFEAFTDIVAELLAMFPTLQATKARAILTRVQAIKAAHPKPPA